MSRVRGKLCIHKKMKLHCLNAGWWGWSGYLNMEIYNIKSSFSSITFKINSGRRYNFLLTESKMSKVSYNHLLLKKFL